MTIEHLVFAIGVRLQQFGQKGLRCGEVIQIKQTTPHCTMFKGDHAPQPPERGLGHRNRCGCAQLLCPLGDDPESRHGSPTNGGKRLDDLQHAVQISFLARHQGFHIGGRGIIQRPQVENPAQGQRMGRGQLLDNRVQRGRVRKTFDRLTQRCQFVGKPFTPSPTAARPIIGQDEPTPRCEGRLGSRQLG